MLKIYINHLDAFLELCYAFSDLVNLTNKSLLNLRTSMLNIGLIRPSQKLEKLGIHVDPSVFYQLHFKKNDSFVSEQDLAMSKTVKLLLVFS